MAKGKNNNKTQQPSQDDIKAISRAEVGNYPSSGANSTSEEVKKLGGIHKLRAKIHAKRNAAKAAEQPHV